MKPWLLVLLLSVGVPAQRMTIGSGSRVRAEPNGQAREVIKLGVGTVLTVTETKRVGDVEWLHVVAEAPVKVDGWMSAALSVAYDDHNRDHLALDVARQRLAAKPVWADDKDAINFLGKAMAQAQDRAVVGELALARLLLMHRSINGGTAYEEVEAWAKKTPGASFDELGGGWMVPASAYWSLHDAAKDTSVAEVIAYEAAKAPVPGECEGSLSCALSVLEYGEGRYLSLYPRGAHSAEIVERMVEALLNFVELPFDEADSAEVNKGISSLKKVIGGLEPSAQKKLLPSVARIEARGKMKR